MSIMNVFAFALALFAFAPAQGLKKCEKIDACRCSTDEGEINLWSLASDTPNQPRFNLGEVKESNIPDETKDSYQWNPCDPWTAQPQTSPNETAQNHCKDVAVCKTREIDVYGTYLVNIGEQELAECVLDHGQCQLKYGVTSDPQIKTFITLVCNEKEEGRVDSMEQFGYSYYTSLYSKCACPGKCNGLSAGAVVGIVIGSIAAFLLLAFAVFICCLRRRLPSGIPKPSMCTTIKVGFGLVFNKLCPCCRRCQYSAVPGK